MLLCAGCLKLGESSELRQAIEPTVVPGDRISCQEILGTAFRSSAEQAWFAENCNKWPLVKVADEPAPGSAPPANTAQNAEPPECAAIRGKPYESNQQRTWYLQNCNQSGNQATTAPTTQGQPGTAQTQPSSGPDRADCNAIRGTPYRSNAERTWFIQNCGSAGPSAAAPQAGGPDRTDCNAIRGTPYRSDAERDWFGANCRT